MISFDTKKERYDVSSWKIIRGNEAIKDIQQLSPGDEIRFNVAFMNTMIDKECVLFIRSFYRGEQTGLMAMEVTIYPDVLPFNLTTDVFIVPGVGIDRLEVALYNDFESVSPWEETEYLIGKNIRGLSPAVLDAATDCFEKAVESVSANPSTYIGDYEPCKRLFDGTICFAQDSESLWIKNGKYRAKSAVIRKDRKMMIPRDTIVGLFGDRVSCPDEYMELSMLADKLGAYSYINRFGLGVISDLPYDYSETKYAKQGQFMMRLLEYERPKACDFANLFKQRIRPACLGYKDEVERAVRLAKTDSRAKMVSDKLMQRAQKAMELPVQYTLDRPRAYSCYLTSIVDYDETMALYWAYLMTDDRKYLDRFKEHVLAMAQLENWCGDHFFLMTARALVTLGMAYDFLYDEFTADERHALAEAMIEKGIKPAFKLYYGQEDEALWPWCIRRTNWNFISNSGIIFAACVLYGEYETEICADALEKAIQSLEYACIYLAPDGEEFEGLGYAAYSWNYMVFAFQALISTFGTAFSLDTSAGFQHSYRIPYSLMTQNGTFSQGDVTTNLRLNTSYTMWWAKRLKDHSIQCMRHMQLNAKIASNATFTDMLWFDDEAYDVSDFDKDYYFESTSSAISRSGWDTDDAVLSVHAGDNTLEHSHADLGNFEYELLGFRFAQEMGIDDVSYCAPGSQYQLRGHDEYYVARAEGHNVYVINPDRTLGQQSIGSAVVDILHMDDDRVCYKVEMESAYRGQVLDARRFYELKEGRKIFTVQDEIVPMNSGDKVYWFWHTFAHIGFSDPMAVEIADNSVVLTAPEGQKLHIQIDANVPYVLRKGMSIPLETSPSPFDQLQGGMISNLLTVHFETGTEPIIVRAVAWEEGTEYDPGELKPFEY